MEERKNGGMAFSMAEQVLEQLPTPVMAVNTDLEIIFLNAAGRELLGKSWEEIGGRQCSLMMNSLHCNTPDCCMKKAIADGKPYSARNEVNIRGRKIPIEYYTAPLRDPDGKIIGGLEYVLDITERVRYEERLREQARTISEISTPAIKLWEGIVILPVVGLVDSMRAQQMMDIMLNKIAETSCKVAILDIQGVPAVDTAVANHLIKIVKATRLMGCQAIISGISPIVAQTIVSLGIDMGVKTNSTLNDALAEAFTLINCEVRPFRAAARSGS
ncbi:MAG TPA: PAS domain-containing protein [Syntrophales bacterium]|nr:PAS domain-containing protein [Syntrophales bacterium]HQJ31593.1 PAS domain-containing protein [Syntrophales bacterium]